MDTPTPTPDDIRALVERAERAEMIAGQLIEALKITPHSVVVVRVKDNVDPEKARDAFELAARLMPPDTTYLMMTDSFSLQIMDEDQMRTVGWVRNKAIDPTIKALFQRVFFEDGRASVSAFQRVNKESWNASRDLLQKLHDDGWLEGLDVSPQLIRKTDSQSPLH